ncbi:MAG: DUF3768 domain-containing protein [Pseudomonadota bacterium]
MLNDAFRRTPRLGVVVVTQGVAALGDEVAERTKRSIAEYDSFCPANDPYGEGDFGSLQMDGRVIFWKIDYFDTAMRMHSPDPADPTVTTRVMTVMLADEY